MKKLIIMAALVVSGLTSAKASVYVSAEKIEKQNSVLIPIAQEKTVEHQLIGVQTWCGKVFYLDLQHYSNYEDLHNDAVYFTNQQCAETKTFVPQYT